MLDRAGAHPGQPGRVSAHRCGRQGGIPEHARGFRAVFVPRKAGGIFDAAERDRIGECDERRRADTIVPGGSEKRLTARFAEETPCWVELAGGAVRVKW